MTLSAIRGFTSDAFAVAALIKEAAWTPAPPKKHPYFEVPSEQKIADLERRAAMGSVAIKVTRIAGYALSAVALFFSIRLFYQACTSPRPKNLYQLMLENERTNLLRAATPLLATAIVSSFCILSNFFERLQRNALYAESQAREASGVFTKWSSNLTVGFKVTPLLAALAWEGYLNENLSSLAESVEEIDSENRLRIQNGGDLVRRTVDQNGGIRVDEEEMKRVLEGSKSNYALTVCKVETAFVSALIQALANSSKLADPSSTLRPLPGLDSVKKLLTRPLTPENSNDTAKKIDGCRGKHGEINWLETLGLKKDSSTVPGYKESLTGVDVKIMSIEDLSEQLREQFFPVGTS